MKIVQATFKGTHFGFDDDSNFAAAETWSHVCGPFFIYVNKATGSNPQATMFADARAQAQAERGAWPYPWFTDSNYAQAAGRGTVTGKIVINDTANPNASAADLWVGVAPQPASTTVPAPTDFQFWNKNYQYWVKSDGAGNFTVPNVVAGANYTLFAFGPGAPGQFQSQALTGASPKVQIDYPASQFTVTVNGGQTTALGNVVWTPARVGPTVFEIGVPDRDTQEFRHGDDYWHGEIGTASAPAQLWAPFQFFPKEWPNGLNYTVGQSHWATDWNYAQPALFDSATGNYNGVTWTITLNLATAPATGALAKLYLGIAADSSGPVVVSVNNTNLGSTSGVTATPNPMTSTGFFVASNYDNDAMIRMSSHGIFCDESVTFPATLLKAGANTITLNMRKGGYFANSAMYDYVRLEMAGYIPPAPASLSAISGNTSVQLRWPATAGATSYKVLRSTTSGNGYAQIASGITGPVSGSTPDTVSYRDATAVNGTAYYYVVQAVNPTGSSVNSVQATATPAASATNAPSAPTGLTATAGDMRVALNWTAPANAAYYLVKRSLTSGGLYTVINDATATNIYIDLGRSNGMTYFYVVDAVNAAGASADSNEATTLPLPPVITSSPPNLIVGNQAGFPALTWSVVTNATGYAVQRATTASDTYTSLTTSRYTASYVDSAAAGNTTYYYRVAASNLGGTSGFSAPVGIITPPGAPATLSAMGASSKVTLNWTPSTGSTGYTIGRSTVSGGAYTTIASSGTDTTYVDRAVANGTTYYYVVASTGAGGTGASSAEAAATPIGVATLTWTGSVNTSWNTTTANWLNAGASAVYVNGQATLFDDTASTDTIVMSGAMTPDNIVFSNSVAYAFTATGLTGATSLTKLGTGTLNISGTDTYTGGTFISGGSVAIVGGTGNAQNGLGTGAITFQGGTLVMNGYTGSSTPSYGTLTNDIKVPAGSAGTWDFSQRGSYTGNVTGGGTLTLGVNYIRGDIGGDWSAFTGQINVKPGANGGDFRLQNTNGFGTAGINLASGVTMYMQVSLGAGGLTNTIGSLTGSGILKGGTTAGRTMTWDVGGANTDAQFDGPIKDGTGPTAITKSGIGDWILTGACTYTGATIVAGGTLSISGSCSGSAGLTVASGAALEIIAPGSFAVNGPVTNNGTVRLYGSATLSSTGAFINNGVLDFINAAATLPANLQNNGVILQASDVRVLAASKSGGKVSLSVHCFAGHAYKLQTASALTTPVWTDVSGSTFTPVSEIIHDFIDPAPGGPQSFYRVVISP